jgi:cation:H+ antiporter
VLAIITILPEYAVEFILAWNAGEAFAIDPNAPEVGYVAANVTGANRLLIGFGWPLVVLAFWIRSRKPLIVPNGLNLEIAVLLIATIVVSVFAWLQFVPIWLGVVLMGMYLFYLWMSSRKESETPDLEGPAATIGGLPKVQRRSMVLGLFAFSAFVILMSAEPFVESLVETGEALGIDEFILIQWLAPLASESPELIVAALFALRANPISGMTALISAEVNQMTVLVGSMPIVFAWSLGELRSFPLDIRQGTEFIFTGALALFAISLFAKMRLNQWHALLLLGIFVAQLVLPLVPGFEELMGEREDGFHWYASLFLLAATVVVFLVDMSRVKAILATFKSLTPSSVDAVREEPA